MASNNIWAYTLLAGCLVIGTLAYPQPAEEDEGPQTTRPRCIPGNAIDIERDNPDSPNNFLPPIPGEEIEISEAPYMVSIHDGNNYLCGAALIGDSSVLASNIHLDKLNLSSNNYYVHDRMGYAHRDHDGCVYRVKEIIINGSLAILKTLTPVYLVPGAIETIGIASPEDPYTPDEIASVIGWGHPKREDRQYSQHTELHLLNVTVKDSQYCTDALGDEIFDSDQMICATGHDGCTGSAPLIQNGRVSGFVDTPFGCGEEGYPMTYTKVATYYDWIEQQINSD